MQQLRHKSTIMTTRSAVAVPLARCLKCMAYTCYVCCATCRLQESVHKRRPRAESLTQLALSPVPSATKQEGRQTVTMMSSWWMTKTRHQVVGTQEIHGGLAWLGMEALSCRTWTKSGVLACT